jgi:dCTP deaminase
LDPGFNSDAIEFEEIPFFSTPFFIQPGAFVLAQTLEYLVLPSGIIGHLDGRSSMGRRGLVVHATAGWIDPGFRGHITLELANLGMMPVALYPAMKIARIVFQSAAGAPDYGGQFQQQLRIRPPKIDDQCARIAQYAARQP